MKKTVLIISLSFVVIVVTILLSRPAYRNYKEKHFLEQAQLFLQTTNHPQAALSARQVLQINPTNVEASKIMADLSNLSGSAQTLNWRQRIVELNPTSENNIALATAALRYENFPFPTATKTLAGIPVKDRQSVSYHLAAADLALKLNRLSDAESSFQEAIKLDPKNETAILNLAITQLSSGNPQTVSAAEEQLQKLGQNPETGLRALRPLVENFTQRGEWMKALPFSEQIDANPRALFLDHIAHLTILQKGNPDAFAAKLHLLQTESLKSPENIYKLSTWMNFHDLADATIIWIKSLPEKIQAKQPIPVALADAYTAKKDWTKLEDYLRVQDWGDKNFIRFAYLARALHNQNEKSTAQVNWQRASRLASEKLETLNILIKMADEWNWQLELTELLWVVLDKFPKEDWALQQLSKIYAKNHDAAGLYRVYKLSLEQRPDDITLKNNVAMLGFLLKNDVEKSHQLIGELYKKDPKNSAIISTYAYSLHLQGKTREGVNLLAALSPAELQNPSTAVYYVILLTEVKDYKTAKEYAPFASKAALFAEERTLLEGATGILDSAR